MVWTAWKLSVLVPKVKVYVAVVQLVTVSTNILDMILLKTGQGRLPEDIFHTLTGLGGSLPNLLAVLFCGQKRTEVAYLKHFLLVCIFQELVMIMTYFAFVI